MTDKGALFVVATPIGNLADISERARAVLSRVDAVAAEDTRRTRELLAHLGVQKPLLSYYEPKENKAIPPIIRLLEQGHDVALVTDAGTPAISDPGYRLVRAAHDAGIKVTPVPGPSAIAAALSVAGLPTDRVTFVGFLPTKSASRKALLAELAPRPDTLVFYESPRRLAGLLEDAFEVLGRRETVVIREISKVYEEQIRGTLDELSARFGRAEVKGEVTVLVAGAESSEVRDEAGAREAIRAALRQGLPKKRIAAMAADLYHVSKKEAYQMALEEEEEIA